MLASLYTWRSEEHAAAIIANSSGAARARLTGGQWARLRHVPTVVLLATRELDGDGGRQAGTQG